MIEAFENAKRVLEAFLADGRNFTTLDLAADMLAEVFAEGKKVLACGNGGSACDAMHFCEELTGRFRKDRTPLAAVSLTDAGHITCVANDYGYDEVFARGVQALGHREVEWKALVGDDVVEVGLAVGRRLERRFGVHGLSSRRRATAGHLRSLAPN